MTMPLYIDVARKKLVRSGDCFQEIRFYSITNSKIQKMWFDSLNVDSTSILHCGILNKIEMGVFIVCSYFST